MRSQRGAPLPYKVLAGVLPAAGRWLVASGRLQGITLFPEEPALYDAFEDVLDAKPAFSVIAAAVPVGLVSEPAPGGRAADREARRLLGWPRAAAIASPPARAALDADTYDQAAKLNDGLSMATWARFRQIAEVNREVQPYWQRTVFEVHPELCFYQLNSDLPLRHPKRTVAGRRERRELLEARLHGIEEVLDAELPGVGPHHLLDAGACLWTARRIAARAITRLPEDPEWDDEGLRMEIIR